VRAAAAAARRAGHCRNREGEWAAATVAERARRRRHRHRHRRARVAAAAADPADGRPPQNR